MFGSGINSEIAASRMLASAQSLDKNYVVCSQATSYDKKKLIDYMHTRFRNS